MEPVALLLLLLFAVLYIAGIVLCIRHRRYGIAVTMIGLLALGVSTLLRVLYEEVAGLGWEWAPVSGNFETPKGVRDNLANADSCIPWQIGSIVVIVAGVVLSVWEFLRDRKPT